MSLTFVQGDTAPDITAVIHDEDNLASIIDLSDAESVRFQMRRADDHRYTVNAAAEVIDAVAGKVSYSWGANDLSTPGTFYVQWEVTWLGGRVQTTSTPAEITVRRQ